MSNRSSDLVGRPCEHDNDCGAVQSRCDDSGRCACYWAWALSGPQCDRMTAMTSWTVGQRGFKILTLLFLMIVVVSEARRTWLVVRKKWLAFTYALILAGCALCQVENVTSFLIITSTSRWTLKQNVYLSNAFNGTGIGCITLGALSLPMMWIDIGLATQRLRATHSGLRKSRRALLAFIVSYGGGMVLLVLATPYYPEV
jgi:hypothetical protein